MMIAIIDKNSDRRDNYDGDYKGIFYGESVLWKLLKNIVKLKDQHLERKWEVVAKVQCDL